MKKLMINCLYIGIVVQVCVMLSACEKDHEKDFGEPLPERIGSAYQGGIVFFIDASGKHGLLAAPTDQSISIVWFNGSFLDTGATSLTDGSTNTDLIINAHGTDSKYAALACRDFRGGGFTDWYLPSKDELNMMYERKTVIKNFGDNIYWSSSQYAVGDIWVQDFATGEQHLDNASDGAGVAVRAIRTY